MKTNKVAKILKVYGIINAIGSLILGLILADNLPGAVEELWIVEVAAGLVASLFIYAFGEAIQLLQDIKDNTEKGAISQPNVDELPEI